MRTRQKIHPSLLHWLLLLLSSAFHPDVHAALPPGFEDEGVVRIPDILDIAFAGNVMLAVSKRGELFTLNLEDPNAEEQVALDIEDRICDNGERGLLSVAVHPNFASSRWIYLFYTYNRGDSDCSLDFVKGPVSRCSRFVLNEDLTVDQNSELILFQTPSHNNQNHLAGDMEFGVDGMLWVTTGDSGGRSEQFSQNLSNLHGNIIRITDSGEIPDDNPFLGEGTARCHETGETNENLICQEIYAYGLRNPFRFAMDPHSTDKVRFMISDVGNNVWEEINEGGEDYMGVNYGWPFLEGPCVYDTVDSCFIGDPNSEFADPFFWYQHDEENSASINGVAIPPPGLNWPAPYNDPTTFYFSDYVRGKFYHATHDPNELCNTCTPPRHGFRNETIHEWPLPVGLKFGPYIDYSASSQDMALYYTAREGEVNIRRIVYKGGDNFAPTASFTADQNNVGGTINFDASETTDPNHSLEELIYTWDFGDSSPEKTGMVVSHQFSTIGVYLVTLIVTDPDGATGTALKEVSVGAPPTVEILSPAEGTTFAVGDVFTLVGTGIDHKGIALDVSTALTWEVRQHHNDHFHPFLAMGTVGNDIVLTEAPEPEDFFAATNSYLEILLTGTDSDGISATVSRYLMPRTVQLDFDTDPTGLTLSLDEEILTMPQRVLTWENHNLRVIAPDQGGYVFAGWVNGVAGSQQDVIAVPASGVFISNPRFVAQFRSTAAGATPDP